MRHILLTILFLWLVVAPSLFANDKELEFIKAVHDVVQKGEAEGIKGVSLEAPNDEESINRFFIAKGLTLNECEILGIDEAKHKWNKVVPRLVDSLDDVKEGDKVMRLSWSNKREGDGRIDVVQYFVITMVDGHRKLKLK